jgi:hypothetical protein
MQLTISIAGPGSLEVGRNNIAHAALRGGELGGGSGGGVFAAASEFLKMANEDLWKGVTFAGGSWSPELVVYPRYALGVASAIAREGHGGAILIVPDADSKNFLARPDWIKVKYACNDDSLWPKMKAVIRGYDEAGDERIQRDAKIAEGELEGLLARVARLAAVDGAVLLTDRLRLLGFGAEVVVQSDVKQVVRGDGRTTPIEDFGTRHRSAFRFCSFYPAGLALVCSQDGGVKAIRHSDGFVRLFEE